MLIGEGSVMFVIKSLSAARRDNDKIHAVIRSVGASSDGMTSGIYTPAIDGQTTALSRAYENAGVSPASVSMVEGHGTGTVHGDVVELTALKKVFENSSHEQVAMGSNIKSHHKCI